MLGFKMIRRQAVQTAIRDNFNSLGHGIYTCNFEYVTFERNLEMYLFSSSGITGFRCMLQGLIDEKLTLARVVA